MFLSRLRYFLISACVIGWLSGFGFPIKDGIYDVLISLNLFSKWFATVFRISFGFVISLPSLSSTLGFSNFPRLRALTAENITSSVCALLIASSCLFSSSFLSCVTFFPDLVSCFIPFFFQFYLLITFLCVIYLNFQFFLALGQVYFLGMWVTSLSYPCCCVAGRVGEGAVCNEQVLTLAKL